MTGRDHSPAHLRALQGRQVPRGAEQPQAGRHRALPVRRVQAGRPAQGRDQPQLPPREPAVLRHGRGQGRRRCRLGGPRRPADRRVRLCDGGRGRRGRRAPAARAGRQGQGGHRLRRPDHPRPAEPERPVDGSRRRAGQREERAPVPHRSRGARCDGPPRRPHRDPGAAPRSHGTGDAQFHQRAGALPLEEHQVGIQRRQGQPAPRRGRLEARRRRRPGAERQAAEDGLPDRHQLGGAEDPGRHQAGRGQGRHRDRAEDRRRPRPSTPRIPPTPTRTRTSSPICSS